MAEKGDIDLIDVTPRQAVSLEGYDCVGFASGEYFGKFHEGMTAFAWQYLPPGKLMFFICTYDMTKENGFKMLTEFAKEKGCPVLSTFGCRGYDTFVPWKLVGGIAKGVAFVMNGQTIAWIRSRPTPFEIFAHGWEKCTSTLDELLFKVDNIVGNDMWIGQNVTVLPGVYIGDGAIIGANAVVASDILPYTIAAGNPCRVIRPRFSTELTEYLLAFRW